MEIFKSFKKMLPAFMLCICILAISGAILNPNFNPKNPMSIFNGLSTFDVGDDVGEADPERLTYTPIDPQPWLGEVIEIVPQIYDKETGQNLINETDFSCTWENNDKVGEAKCIVEGKGNYGGALIIPFTIAKPSGIADCTLKEAIPDKVFTGFEQRPSFFIQKNGTEYEVNEDTFDCVFIDNVNAGQATIKVQPKAADRDLWDYDENMPLIIHFNIVPRALNDSFIDWTFTPTCDCEGEHKENGTAHTASIAGRIKDAAINTLLNESDWGYNKNVKPDNLAISKSNLSENIDFTVNATDNINAGLAKFTVTGIGNFSGSIADFSFPIVKEEPPASTPGSLTLNLTANSKSAEYNGLSQSVTGFSATYRDGLGYEVTGSDGKIYYVDGITSTASGINANSYSISVDTTNAVVKDKDGNRITDFDLKVSPGVLTINPRLLRVTSKNINKEYDGKELTNGSFGLEFDGLIGNDTFIPTFTGKQKEVGSSDNTFTLRPGPGTIAENYTIVAIYGKLTVIKTNNADKKDDADKDKDEKNEDEKPAVTPIPKPTPKKAPTRIKAANKASDPLIRLILKPSEEEKVVTVRSSSGDGTSGNTAATRPASAPEITVNKEASSVVIKSDAKTDNKVTQNSEGTPERELTEESGDLMPEEEESLEEEYPAMEETTSDTDTTEEITDEITDEIAGNDYYDEEDEVMAIEPEQQSSGVKAVFLAIVNGIKGLNKVVKILLVLLPIVVIAVIFIIILLRKRKEESVEEDKKEDSNIFFDNQNKTPPNISL